MTYIEHLLIKLTEESAEIIHHTDKALLFGLKDGYPDSGSTNIQDISREINDLFAVIEMLQEAGVEFHNLFDREAISAKKKKIICWMERARQLNTLT